MLHLTFRVEGAEPATTASLQVAIFRIVQEALSNVSRHSGASRVEVHLFFNDQEVKGQAKVCVLGTTVRDVLFPDGEDPMGKTIRVGGLPFEVIGVLEGKTAIPNVIVILWY